jgi:hypothetical protein
VQSVLNRPVFFTASDETCFKWKPAHGLLEHRGVYPNAPGVMYCAVRWPLSGWRWQCNSKDLTFLRARAIKQPPGY